MTIAKQPLLDWTNLPQWRDVILDAALQLFAPTKSIAWLKALPSPSAGWDEYLRIEPLRNEAGLDNDDEDDDVERGEFLRVLGTHLPRIFDKLRAVHLCRPVDFDSYRRQGLRRLNPKVMQRDLIDFFKSEHPEVTEADLRRAIAQMPVKLREDRVYFGIDERALLRDCGQYACYGSEYQICVARLIVGDGRTDYCQTLKRRGRPAFVEAHLPITLIDDRTLAELADDLLQAAVWSLQLDKPESPFNHFGFDLFRDIPPEMVRDVVHAPQARDRYSR